MNKNIVEYCKNQYDFELEQQENFNNYFGLYIGFFGLLLSGMSFPYSDIGQIQSYATATAITFYFFYFIAIVSILGFIYFTIKHQVGLEYQRSPHAKTLLEYYYENMPQLQENAQKTICEEYANAAFHNFNVNLKKAAFFRYAKFCLLFLVVSESCAYLDYHCINKNDKISIVKVVKS
ncbi:MAG: hypothetical protein K0R14_668 [Burkholderiales bacterium]|jgi:hypothetical protein|nr:hypothetical protein [Burkholderiales bacterium]